MARLSNGYEVKCKILAMWVFFVKPCWIFKFVLRKTLLSQSEVISGIECSRRKFEKINNKRV